MAYDTADGFRAEVRDAGGVVKGVYGFTGPNGNIITKTYLSDGKGYRLASLSEMGVELPPLPYNLHPKAGQRKFPKEDTSEIKAETLKEEEEEPISNTYKHPVQINPFGRFDHGSEAIVIEPAVKHLGRFIKQEEDDEEDYNDIVIVGEDYGEAIGALAGRPAGHPVDTGPAQPGLQEIVGTLPFPVKPGQSVSHISPSATAIAIAGGQAIAIAGVQNPGQQFFGGSGSGTGGAQEQDVNRPGWEALRSATHNHWFFNPKSVPSPSIPIEIKGPEGSQITSFPIVANYFFNVPQHFFSQARAATVEQPAKSYPYNQPGSQHSQVVYVPWYTNQDRTS